MTRADIESHIAENVGDIFGTTGESSKTFAYQKLITQACDEYARRTGCYWKVSTMPLVANQAQYCAPQIMEYQAVTAFTTDGNIHMLDTVTVPGMDDWGGATWRNQTAQSQPTTLINIGLNYIVLSPAPNYSSTVYNYVDLVLGSGGLTLSNVARPFVNAAAPAGDVGLFVNVTSGTGFTAGWYRITSVSGGVATLLTSAGTAGSVGGAGVLTSGGLWIEGPGTPGEIWEAKTDPCPLPDRAHMGVVWQAALWRCIRNPSAANQQRYTWLQQQLTESMNQLEREAHTVTPASRVPAMIGAGGYSSGAWDTNYGNPLNL